jgi:triacylglycerol lipase
MNPLGLVTTGPSPAEPAAPAQLQLHILNVVASRRRVWFRGQIIGLPEPAAKPKRWWPRRQAEPEPPPLIVRLETHVGGQVLQADVPVGPDGLLEATFTADLPPTRRGWRVARNQVTLDQQTLEACTVVATPPADAAGVTLVLLPAGMTFGSPDELAKLRSPSLTAQLHELAGGPHGQALCYLAAVPHQSELLPADLALAIASLGWPTGTLILLPGDEGLESALPQALDRLRWLFAGLLPLQLLNLDPTAGDVTALLQPVEDRAAVSLVAPPVNGNGASEWVSRRDRRTGVLRLARGGLQTRYPLVFCHGMLACTMLRMQLSKNCNYFAVMEDVLRQRGFHALFPVVTPTGGVAARAAELREQIRSWTDEPVNIIAHSMGGLDARWMITHLGMADRVKSLTMISTPNRGSYLADWFLANYRRRVPLLLALEAMGVNVDGFGDCRPAICSSFNTATPDQPGVKYFSYDADVPQVRVSPMLRRGWSLLQREEGPNDGLVAAASARWGEHLGTLHADHFAQTPDGLFVRPAETFDSAAFFLRLIEDLGRRGF